MRTPAPFGEKKFEFIEIYGVAARTGGRGIEPVRTFADKGRRGQFLAILCGRLFG